MIVSDGYSLSYERKKNRIVILLPQTAETMMDTMSLPVKRQDRSEEELLILLLITRQLFEVNDLEDWTPQDLTKAEIADINNAPTIDAEPVRHGHWIKMSDADGHYYACSECGEELYREWSFDREFDTFPKKKSIDKTQFCPNCGAKMDEVNDE